ncbi:catechol 1,2-dioxygenase [Oleomonas cavernae]|uniref:Catechol 1,2-dioxygenase n=1 Tax=Oleomonas cavernae TaxID=2320859 RepID=A0A418WFA7_9PROT|nr:dioxygenase [Oleomonas cavernae]RJF88609.1 catechol 1,2-dioxygenase [Oleomonas cavernae]
MPNARAQELVEGLQKTIFEFMREHKVTHDEYRVATDLLAETIQAGEQSLLYDIFFEAEVTDIANTGRDGSPEAIEGPFYLPGAPELEAPFMLTQRADEKGDVLLFMGRVTDTAGRPLADAEIDLWHADADGRYSNIDPSVPAWNLRGRFRTDAEGRYKVRTIVPQSYEIPKCGPTGRVLDALGRHCFRPAHLHVKIRHPDVGEMTSQIYFKGGRYLESDSANAVRDGLIAELIRHERDEDLAAHNLDKPYFDVTYNFVLPSGVLAVARAVA